MKQSIALFIVFVSFITTSAAAFGQKNLGQIAKSSGQIERSTKLRPAVVIETPEAFTEGDGVYIRWRTTQEKDNLGFYVIRTDGKSTEFVDNRFIAGSAIHSRHEAIYGAEYGLFDAKGTAQSQYMIESFELSGKRTLTDPVFPTFVADLAKIAGNSNEKFTRRKAGSSGLLSSEQASYSKEIQSEIDDSTQLADPVTQRWVAAQPGAKIGVRQTGIYRVTRAQLSAAGFDVNSDPNLWQLYTDGVEQAVIVDPSGDYVDFYGRSIDTLESDTRMYYLVVGTQPGKRMANVGFRPSVSNVRAQNFDASTSVKERQNYVFELRNGDADNYFGHLISSNISTTNVSLVGADPSAFEARISVRALGFSSTVHTFNFSINGHPIGQMTGVTVQQMSLDVVVPGSYLVDGVNALSMVSTASNDFGFFDQVQISYKRRHVADQNRVSFSTQNYRGAKLENFSSSNIRIFDITYDGSPALMTGAVITPDGGTFDANIPAYRARAMFAVEDSGLLAPASVSLNVPSMLSTTNHNADLVIISYKDFITQANAWADYRRGQGISVEVVNVEDVYDEFAFGVLSSNSLKDFLNFARQNWLTPPRYVLLIGDSTYDPRNYEGNGFRDFIPTKLFDTDFEEAPSDDALVDFDNNGLAELAIGRIPAQNSATVTNALSKTTSFEANIASQNLSRGFVCNYDNPIGWDFQGMCQQMANQLPAGTTSVLVPRADTNPNATLVSELNNGRYFVNFSGHGTTGSWSSGSNFAINHVPLLTNLNGLSIFTMLTCLNGYFVGPNTSMAEGLLNSTTGGAAAAWASTGETTPDIQQLMGVHFYSQVAAGQITRLGDLIIDAKTVVPGGRDVRLTWVLLGDPMLKTR